MQQKQAGSLFHEDNGVLGGKLFYLPENIFGDLYK
jgi:hypothetical protein